MFSNKFYCFYWHAGLNGLTITNNMDIHNCNKGNSTDSNSLDNDSTTDKSHNDDKTIRHLQALLYPILWPLLNLRPFPPTPWTFSTQPGREVVPLVVVGDLVHLLYFLVVGQVSVGVASLLDVLSKARQEQPRNWRRRGEWWQLSVFRKSSLLTSYRLPH